MFSDETNQYDINKSFNNKYPRNESGGTRGYRGQYQERPAQYNSWYDYDINNKVLKILRILN